MLVESLAVEETFDGLEGDLFLNLAVNVGQTVVEVVAADLGRWIEVVAVPSELGTGLVARAAVLEAVRSEVDVLVFLKLPQSTQSMFLSVERVFLLETPRRFLDNLESVPSSVEACGVVVSAVPPQVLLVEMADVRAMRRRLLAHRKPPTVLDNILVASRAIGHVQDAFGRLDWMHLGSLERIYTSKALLAVVWHKSHPSINVDVAVRQAVRAHVGHSEGNLVGVMGEHPLTWSELAKTEVLG